MNKNLSEFENKLPSVLEYDTQQLLDYYYESPEKMKIAEVFSEFLTEKGIKVELKEIGEYQYIYEIETGYYLLPLFVGGGTTDKRMSVSINVHLFHEKYFPEGMKNWNGSQMNLNYKDSLVQAFENWFNYDRLNYLKLVNPDKTDLRRIKINGKKKIIVSGNVKTIYNYDEEKHQEKEREENFGNLKEKDRGHEGDFAFTMAEVLFDKMIHCGYNVRLMADWVYDFDNECYLLPLLSTKDYKTIPHDDIYQVVTTIQVHNKKYFPEGKLYIQKLIGEPLYDAIWINYRNWINNDYKKLCESI